MPPSAGGHPLCVLSDLDGKPYAPLARSDYKIDNSIAGLRSARSTAGLHEFAQGCTALEGNDMNSLNELAKAANAVQ